MRPGYLRYSQLAAHGLAEFVPYKQVVEGRAKQDDAGQVDEGGCELGGDGAPRNGALRVRKVAASVRAGEDARARGEVDRDKDGEGGCNVDEDIVVVVVWICVDAVLVVGD